MSMYTEAYFDLPEQYTTQQIEEIAQKSFDCVSIRKENDRAIIFIGELNLEEAIACILYPLSKRFGFTFNITNGTYYAKGKKV